MNKIYYITGSKLDKYDSPYRSVHNSASEGKFVSSATPKNLFKHSSLFIALTALFLNATPTIAADTIIDGGQTITVPGTQPDLTHQ